MYKTEIDYSRTLFWYSIRLSCWKNSNAKL